LIYLVSASPKPKAHNLRD